MGVSCAVPPPVGVRVSSGGVPDEAVAGSRVSVARPPACEEHCRAVCGADMQDALGIPRDPDRCGQGPRGRLRRSKPDAINLTLALRRGRPKCDFGPSWVS